MKGCLAGCVGLFVFLEVAYAGRPIETDDASVTSHRTCQLDFWVETATQTRQDNFNGGCNFFGSSELSLSLSTARGDSQDALRHGVGYKQILREFTSQHIGFGFAVSTERTRLDQGGSARETLGTAIATMPLGGTQTLLHLNLGYLDYRDSLINDERPFVAAALDYQWTSSTGLSMEAFNGVEGSVSWRLGARYTLIPDYLQIDASYGSDFGQYVDSRAFTIGVGFTPAF